MYKKKLHSYSIDDQFEVWLSRLDNKSSIVLAMMATVGLATIIVLAPNVVQVLSLFYKKRKIYYNPEELKTKTNSTFYYLKKHGYIEFKKEEQGLVAKLTSKGREKFKQIQLDLISIPKPKHWDKKWWLVAADIPTIPHKYSADLFRKKLKELGFFTLQRTLWLYPHDPRAELQFLLETYGLEKYVTIFEINRLDESDMGMVSNYFYKSKVI